MWRATLSRAGVSPMPRYNAYDQVHEYLRGELTPIDAARFERAVREDATLSREVASARRTFATLDRLLPSATPSAGGPEDIRARIEQQVQDEGLRPSIAALAYEVGPRRRRRLLALAAAVMLAAGSAVYVAVVTQTGTERPGDTRVARAEVVMAEGDVLIREVAPDGEPVTVPWRSDGTPGGGARVLGGQQIVTRGNARAVVEIGHGRVVLAGSSALTVLDPQAPTPGSWVRLDRGLALFELPPEPADAPDRGRGRDDNVPSSRVSPPDPRADDGAGAGRGPVAPRRGADGRDFVVRTPHGELRVRGTRFVVRVQARLTTLVVLRGRVDILRERDGDPIVDLETVTGGEFALVGDPAAVAVARPSPLSGGVPHPGDGEGVSRPDGTSGGVRDPAASGAPPSRPSLYRQPILSLSITVSSEAASLRRGARASVTVRNVSPLPLRLASRFNEDNLKLFYRSAENADYFWAGVRPVRIDRLPPGGARSFEVRVQPEFVDFREGPFYVAAAYDGLVELTGELAAAFGLPDRQAASAISPPRTSTGVELVAQPLQMEALVYSSFRAVVYQAAAEPGPSGGEDEGADADDG